MTKQNKMLFFDVETTGTDREKHDIIQFACIIDIDGKIERRRNLLMQPSDFAAIEPRALEIQNVTIEQVKEYPDRKKQYHQILKLFHEFISPYYKEDKFTVCGYNVDFDVDFLKKLFKSYDNKYLFSFLGSKVDPLPVIRFLIAIGKIPQLENNKLETVCSHFNIPIKAHDAMSDIEATRQLYYILKGFVS
jgi:DNA polymerase-3 subunit epsilon